MANANSSTSGRRVLSWRKGHVSRSRMISGDFKAVRKQNSDLVTGPRFTCRGKKKEQNTEKHLFDWQNCVSLLFHSEINCALLLLLLSRGLPAFGRKLCLQPRGPQSNRLLLEGTPYKTKTGSRTAFRVIAKLSLIFPVLQLEARRTHPAFVKLATRLEADSNMAVISLLKAEISGIR